MVSLYEKVKSPFSYTTVGRKLYLEGMTKKIFFEWHYFLRLQQQFQEKWGAHAPPPALPVPTALSYYCSTRKSGPKGSSALESRNEKHLEFWKKYCKAKVRLCQPKKSNIFSSNSTFLYNVIQSKLEKVITIFPTNC